MKAKPFLVGVLYFIAVIVLAHFFVPPKYDWTQNTISDLASQGHVYKWIMQAGFIGFGGILITGAVIYIRKDYHAYFLLFVVVYGLSILLSGIFCTAPIDPSMPFSVGESQLHSLFATTAGIAMSLGIGWQVLASKTNSQRWTRVVFFIMIVAISGLFGLAENHVLDFDKGIIQRALYLAGLAWLVYEERMFNLGKGNSK